MNQFTHLICLAFILGTIQLRAQVFEPYLAFGTNITDDYLTESGNSQVLTRMGPNVGIGVSGRISKRLRTNMEILYSQNGYYTNLIEVPTDPLDKIVTRYIEVPLILTYRFNIKQREKQSFNKLSFSGGIAYAHLFNHKIITTDGRDLSNEIGFDQKDVLLFNVGAISFFTNSFALNGRGTISPFGGWTIAIRVLYYFISN